MLKGAGRRLLVTPFHVRARRVERIYPRGIEVGDKMENRSGEERLVQMGNLTSKGKNKGNLMTFIKYMSDFYEKVLEN